MVQPSASKATPEQLQGFYEELLSRVWAPCGRCRNKALTSEPRSKAVPYLWQWRELQPKALQAGELVGTRDAERRVLMLLNPGLAAG